MNLKRKFMSIIAPILPTKVKVKALYEKAYQYYLDIQPIEQRGIKFIDELYLIQRKRNAKNNATNEIKRLIQQDRINKMFLVYIENYC